MLSKLAIERILGIETSTDLQPEQMAKKLVFTFFPYSSESCSRETLIFKDLLEAALLELGVRIVPYEKSLEKISIATILKRFLKICANNFLYTVLEMINKDHSYHNIHAGAFLNLFKRMRIRKGITVVALGENRSSQLPMDYTSSFTQNTIITVLKCPAGIDETSNFSTHFDAAMNIFSYHMTQIAILVSADKFIIYNFNASHPVYPLHKNFKGNILKALIPKVAAPIRPPYLKDFIVEPESFDVDSDPYKTLLKDFVTGGEKFNKTNLYPPGKKVEDLPFRSGFYKWIGKLHLDHRSGMSYGFLARQLPSVPVGLVPLSDEDISKHSIKLGQDYFIKNDELYLIMELPLGRFFLKVPDVWVLTQRSGSDKTKIDPHRDIFLMGLVNGKMYLRTPIGCRIRRDYRPSFDTRVILAHAVGNAIISSVLNRIEKSTGIQQEFSNRMAKNGVALVHWHGYIQHNLIPEGFYVHGYDNPHVACSTIQSSIYALAGKMDVFENALKSKSLYMGDVHIEPHHGTNIVFSSIEDLAEFLISTPNASELGNKYLYQGMMK